MPMDSVSEENVEKLIKDKENKEEKLRLLKNKTIEIIWNEELEILKNNYLDYKKSREKLQNSSIEQKKKKKLKIK